MVLCLCVAALASSQLVVFGGEHIDKPGASKADHKLNDLWAYAAGANEWQRLAKSSCKEREGSVLTRAAAACAAAGPDMLLLAGAAAILTCAAAAAAWQRHDVGSAVSRKSAPHVMVEMAGELAAKAAGAATRKKGYQRIN